MAGAVERSCCVCRTKKPKSQLVRFVVTGETLVYDPQQNMAGRGVYFCSPDCWNSASSKGRRIKVDSKSPKGAYVALPQISFEQATHQK
ncbi:MAG: YlxR family protein [Patescibacteria group bacterium]